ncbi:hypothetical protein [Actinacidiphila glaucinigra]|uniref:hypothetical protein n=1 Tax=Actinacidiphila glaucinigra TaxID=235986 RepID=UPI003712E714
MGVAWVPIVVGVLVVAAMIYDAARLITTGESRCPLLSRLRGHRAALEAAERWCTGLRLHGRIDVATYQHRMSAIAHGHRTVVQRPRRRSVKDAPSRTRWLARRRPLDRRGALRISPAGGRSAPLRMTR